MNRLRRSYQANRLRLQTQLGRSPLLYAAVHRLRDTARSRNLVSEATDVCIEAPSGSGNSFFVNGFRMINLGLRVAHHHHVGAQLKRAVSLRVPTLVILRNPIDCVASRSRGAPWMTQPVFDQWIRFFAIAELLLPSLVLVTFEAVTRDPDGAVERLNARFSRSFAAAFPPPESVFAHMDEAYARVRPEDSRNPNRPDGSRADARREARRVAELHRLAAPAIALYERLAQAAEGRYARPALADRGGVR